MALQRRFDSIAGKLFPHGGKILLAVSGGVDSMVMASLFAGSSVNGLSFAAAHCNFHLRAAESDGDAATVSAWAEKHNVQLFVKHFDTEGYAGRHNLSVEMAARELRYEWFAQLASSHGFDAVAIAHNSNDNAETLILNLLRGTGLRGLTGMRQVSWISAETGKVLSRPSEPEFQTEPAEAGQSRQMSLEEAAAETGGGARRAEAVMVVRPLLDFSREEILEYAVSHGVKWREDSTNADVRYKRNLVRNSVFPLFERINPSFLRTLVEDSARFSQAQSMLDEYSDILTREIISPSETSDAEGVAGETMAQRLSADPAASAEARDVLWGQAAVAEVRDGFSINIEKLRGCRHSEYLLHHVLSPLGFNSDTISAINALITNQSANSRISGKTFCGSGYEAVTASQEIIVRKAGTEESDEMITVTDPGIYCLGGQKFQVSVEPVPKNLKTGEGESIMDADKALFPFTARRWRSGDWMRPMGMRGNKKLSDIFIDGHFSLIDKAEAIVLAPGSGNKASAPGSGSAAPKDGKEGLSSDRRVYAIVGHRIDDSVKVGKGSTAVLRIVKVGMN